MPGTVQRDHAQRRHVRARYLITRLCPNTRRRQRHDQRLRATGGAARPTAPADKGGQLLRRRCGRPTPLAQPRLTTESSSAPWAVATPSASPRRSFIDDNRVGRKHEELNDRNDSDPWPLGCRAVRAAGRGRPAVRRRDRHGRRRRWSPRRRMRSSRTSCSSSTTRGAWRRTTCRTMPTSPAGKYGRFAAQCNGLAYNPSITYTVPVTPPAPTWPRAPYFPSPTAPRRYPYYFTYSGSQPALGYAYTRQRCRHDHLLPGVRQQRRRVAGQRPFYQGDCHVGEHHQNYRNWYTYYRTRMLTMRSAASQAFKGIDDKYRVGFSRSARPWSTATSSSTRPTSTRRKRRRGTRGCSAPNPSG